MDVTDFPDDLVQTQAAWNATYQALAAPPPTRHHRPAPPPAAPVRTAVVAPLVGGTVFSVPAARSELRHLARAHGAVRAS
ncbi:hypothetical protein [Streptomyces sp. NPDC002676]